MGWTRRKRVVAVLSSAAGAGAMGIMAAAGPAGAADFGPVDPTIPDGNTDSLRDILEDQVNDGDVVILQTGAATLTIERSTITENVALSSSDGAASSPMVRWWCAIPRSATTPPPTTVARPTAMAPSRW
jgi:hypothetical protein